ncbi:MAG: hypothetical protein M9894_09090 [Planctomycetes bacterium]|nr:hypothetical protein [Planctomycetota bacterium]
MALARRAPALVALAGAALLFPVQGRLDARRTPPPDVLEVLPPRAILRVLTFGHPQTAANLLEIRATNFLMRWLEGMDRLRHEHISRLYDAILALDPMDAGAYRRASVYFYSVADRADLARAFLERGIDPARGVPVGHPGRWLLFVELASIELLDGLGKPEDERVEHVRRGGELLQRAVGLPGAPPELEAFARRLATRGLSPLEALRYDEQRWLDAAGHGEPAMRAQAERRLTETRAALIAQALQQVADDVAQQAGAPPGDLDALWRFIDAALRHHERGGGRLPDALEVLREHGVEDPLGVGYRLEEGRVIAPGVEARRLQRALEERFHRWQQARPGEVPTAEELGLVTASPRLEVRIDRDGVRVTPR